MIEPATRVDDFYRELLTESEVATPLCAYADAQAAHYVFLGGGQLYARSLRFGADRRLRALSAVWPLFSWDEREMAQDFGIAIEGLSDARPLRLSAHAMPEAVVARGEGLMRFVVGPVHAGIIEPGRFTFSSGGETIVYLDAQLGYSHRGIEQALERADAVGAAPRVARVCGSCSAARSFAYARALEQLGGIDLALEVELGRVAIAELERIYNHLADLAASAAGAGYAVGFARGMALKERAMRLCQAATGHRLLFDAIVPGGLGENIAGGCFDFIDDLWQLESDARRFVDDLFANDSLVSRWMRAGFVPLETAQACGAVGPAARASGSLLDLRIAAAYGAYPNLSVTLAHATAGDAFARCAVKRDELAESFRLVRSALAELNGIRFPVPRRVVPAAAAAIGAVEGPRGIEIVALHVDAQGRIERIHILSASYRNWPIVARAMENNIVPDFPLVNKSFNLCYACADR